MSVLSDASSQDKVDETIEKLANLIVRKYRLPEPAIMMLMGLKPVAPIVSTSMFLTVFPFTPIFDALPGIDNSDKIIMKYMDVFKNGENVERLIRKIEEITTQAKKEEQQEISVGKRDTSANRERLKLWFKRLR